MKKNLLIVLFIITSFVSNAQFSQVSNIYPENITAGDEFGSAVAIDGDFMAVGAYYYNDASTSPGTGSVYMWHYDGTNWVYDSQIIPANNPYNGDQFGNAVAISGNDMIVGAWNGSTDGDHNPGTVTFYNYDGTSWTGEMKWVCGINQYDLGYGTDVDLYGDYAIVGAPGVDNNHGRAYVYFKNSGTWEMQQNLVHTSTTEDNFGSSVAIGNNIAFVGAKDENKVYVYTYDGTNWNNTSTITPSTTGVSFGNSMSYDGTNLIIGDVGDNSAYIFTFDGTNWVEQKVTASDVASTDHFGCNVSIDGNYAIVGAWSKNSMTGASYIFKNTGGTWSQSQKITASNGNSNDRFGTSVAIQNNTAVVGAYYDNPSSMGNYAGSAYIFNMPPPPAPVITTQPQNTTVCEGNTAVFNITATDADNYQWYKDALPLSNGGNISGATSNTLTINNTTLANNGETYSCTVTGTGGSLTSNTVSLTVDELIAATAGDDQFVTTTYATLDGNTPSSGTGTWSGTGLTFTNTNENTPTATVNGLAIGGNTVTWTITNGECQTSDEVVITRCEPIVITNQPQNAVVCEGSDVYFSITQTGADDYQWYKDGNALVDGGNISGAGTYSLTISTSSETDIATYSCTISNDCDTKYSNEVTLNVDEIVSANAGADDFTYSTTYTLNAVNPTLGTGEWFSYTTTITFDAPTNNTSTVNGLEIGSNTLIWTVTNGECQTSDEVVITRCEPIVITNQPQNAVVCAGSDVYFSITQTGADDYQWYKDGNALVDGGNISGAGTYSLTISTSSATDIATYSCTISNDCGNLSSVGATLDVKEMIIADAGDDQTVCSTITTLNAATPANTTGIWTTNGGATITDNSDPNTTVANLDEGENIFTWEVANSTCSNSSDDVIITFENVQANFTATPETQTWPNNTISITNNSTEGMESYSLNYGDGMQFIDYEYISTYTHTFDTWGEYTVSIDVWGENCNDTYSQTIIILNGDYISDIDNKFSIYPNPVKNYFQIEGISDIVEITIFSADGKKVLNQKTSINQNIDVSSLQSGLYILKINSNNKNYSLKFTKE